MTATPTPPPRAPKGGARPIGWLVVIMVVALFAGMCWLGYVPRPVAIAAH